MSNSYQARRGLNTTYLQNLNALSPIEEPLDQYNPAEDLSLWTDTTFFDYDMGAQITHDPSSEIKHNKPVVAVPESIEQNTQDGGFDDFMNDFKEFENFEYTAEFPGFNEHSQPTFLAQQPIETQHRNIPVSISIPHSPLNTNFAHQDSVSPSAPTPTTAPRSAKRKASVSEISSPSPDNLEGASRLAAEEDKRRRNTAASARFRVKKKQKEQQLEKTAKEMTDRVGALEARIQTLEMENKWLKNLIVEKNGGKSGEEIMIPPSVLAGNKDGAGNFDLKAEI